MNIASLPAYRPLVDVCKKRADSKFEVGWRVNGLLAEAWERESADGQTADKRFVYSEVLTSVAEKVAPYFDKGRPEAARKNLGDYARITRYWTPERVSEMSAEFSEFGFEKARACYCGAGDECNDAETSKRVRQAVDKGWPSVTELRELFGEPETLPDEARLWLRLQKAAQKYLDATVTTDNPTVNERRKVAAKVAQEQK